MPNSLQQTKPDYGFDGSPWTVTCVFLAGLAGLGGGIALLSQPGLFLKLLACVLIPCGLGLVLVCCAYLYYIQFGKRQRRDKMIAMIDWQGTEHVLDIGTGRGLLMIAAAQKLTLGKSIGIDIWNAADMHSNTYQHTHRNAELEGVIEKVEVRKEDVRSMSFPKETFDVVLSNLCLHNIPDQAGREQACREIARVLKPHGTAIIADKSHTKQYADIFTREGLCVELFRPAFDGSLRGMVKAVKK